MREEFVEPMPVLKADATLIIGKVRTKCFVVDATIDEFRVAVPGAEQYEGDPRMLLVSGDVIYPVHLVLQEAHAGGYSYRLRRVTDAPTSHNGFLKNFYIHHPGLKVIATGLALSAITSFWVATSENDSVQLLCLRSIRRELSSWWPPAIKDSDRVPPGISIDKSLVVKKDQKIKQRAVKKAAPVQEADDSISELKTVSMISPASMSAPSLLPHEENHTPTRPADSNPAKRPAKKKVVTLATLLDEGQVGRLRTLNPELIPWLYGKNPANHLGYLKVSDAAYQDLQQFELSLRGLPIETCMQAIESLKGSLKRSNDINNARTVHGFDDIFVVRSADADVFFRSRKGMAEIVRVLPTDYNRAE